MTGEKWMLLVRMSRISSNQSVIIDHGTWERKDIERAIHTAIFLQNDFRLKGYVKKAQTLPASLLFAPSSCKIRVVFHAISTRLIRTRC